MTKENDGVTEMPKKKPGRPPAPKAVELKVGLESKDGMWKLCELRGDVWIVMPTDANKRAYGKVPMSANAVKEFFGV